MKFWKNVLAAFAALLFLIVFCGVVAGLFLRVMFWSAGLT